MGVKIKRRDTGFTIIEILIVLAIAGLILLIVFLAVPALQRNSRNTGRRTDISRIAGAVNEYLNNSNNVLPACPSFGSSGATIITSAGDLGQYTFVPTDGGANTADQFTCVKSLLPQNPLTRNANQARLVEGAACDTATAGATVPATSSRAMALQFTLESGKNAPTASCINI